jgi:hypothetical protein
MSVKRQMVGEMTLCASRQSSQSVGEIAHRKSPELLSGSRVLPLEGKEGFA